MERWAVVIERALVTEDLLEELSEETFKVLGFIFFLMVYMCESECMVPRDGITHNGLGPPT